MKSTPAPASPRALRFWLALILTASLLGACSDDTRAQNDATDTAQNTDLQDTSRVDARETTADMVSDASDATDAPDVLPIDLTLSTAEEAYAAVDHFIGTGGVGFGFSGLTPAAQAPLGLVRLGPDTTAAGSHPRHAHFGGYNAEDPDVRGFSHLHFVGTGVSDYGNLRVAPLADLTTAPGSDYSPKVAESEHAEPGFYEVDLLDPEVHVELTSTLRVGVHRYTFARDGRVYLAIDPASSVNDDGVLASSVTIEATGEVHGWVEYRGSYVGRGNAFTLHFSATLSRPFDDAFVWDDAGYQMGTLSASAMSTGAALAFDDVNGEPITMKVGLSMVDLDNARLNRAEEADDDDFDALRAQTKARWLNKLGRIQVAGGSEAQRRVFFTALYNTYRMPTRFDDVDGRYRGLDAVERPGGGFAYYSDLSLWDSFRTTHPLYTLIDQEVQRDCLRSLLVMSETGGVVPRWPAALSYTGGMIGTSADFLFAESAIKGVDGVDYEAAFDALMVTAMGDPPAGSGHGGRGGMADYMSYGYLPADLHDESVSRTLEFAYADGALALLAERLGRPEAAALAARGKNYANLFDPDVRFFRPRNADGSFADFSALAFTSREGHFTEGNAWHWRFYAPHDPEGLITLLGGDDAFATSLDVFFSSSALGKGSGPIATGIFDLFYWHGNQPSLHTVHLFMAAGRPDLYARWLGEIQTRLYHDTPSGIPGNDDGGTLSAWYVFSALGFFPLAGTDRYIVGSPIFPRAVVLLESGAEIVIDAHATSDTHRQVSAFSIDGALHEGWSFEHDRIAEGASLFFEMDEITP